MAGNPRNKVGNARINKRIMGFSRNRPILINAMIKIMGRERGIKMKYVNHYAVSPNKNQSPTAKLRNAAESFVLSLCPTTHLFLPDCVVDAVNYKVRIDEDSAELFPANANDRKKVVLDTLQNLVTSKFIKLVESTALERFVEKL